MKPWGPRPASPTKTSLWANHDESYDGPPFHVRRLAESHREDRHWTMYVAVDHSIYQPDNLSQHAKDGEQAS